MEVLENITKKQKIPWKENLKSIWVWSGINDQFTIKCSTYNRETRDSIESDFEFNVNRGNATMIKILDYYSKEE